MNTSTAPPRGFTATCLAALGFNILWAIMLPTASGRLVAAFGTCIAAVLLLVGHASRDVRQRLSSTPPAFFVWRVSPAVVSFAFLTPVLFLRTATVFGFWRFDSRAALLVAWLGLTAVALALESRRPAAQLLWNRWLIAAFLTFAAAVWLTVVMDSGVASFMVNFDRRGPRGCQSDPMTEMATVWESNRPSDHLYLAWRSQDGFDHRIVYANHFHPYLLTMYAWIKAARRAGGLTLWQASNTSLLLPILTLIGAFVVLAVRSGVLRGAPTVRDLLTVFLGMGVLLTTWRLWIDLVRFNSDNPYPLLAALCVLVYALLLPPMRTGSAAVAAAAFAALSPPNAPTLLVPVLGLFTKTGRNWREAWKENRSVLVVCGAALIAAALSYLDPRLLISWKGYQAQGSSFLFRSGLDGDTRYFSGLLQAAIAPCPTNCCYARTLSDLLWPAAVPLAIFGPFTLRPNRTSDFSAVRTILFLATPYLVALIAFPQSVSVHPYLYDHLLLIPIVVTGVLAMLDVSRELRVGSAGLLALLLVVSAVLMSNLIGIAQGLARAIAYFTS
jgi:hypothetical protein